MGAGRRRVSGCPATPVMEEPDIGRSFAFDNRDASKVFAAWAHKMRGGLIWWIMTGLFVALTIAFVMDAHGVDRILLFGGPGPIEGHNLQRAFASTARAISLIGNPTLAIPLSLLLAVWLALKGMRLQAAFAFASIIGGAAFCYLLKASIDVFRPHHVPGSFEFSSTSFPSGHAFLSAIMLATIVLISCDGRSMPVRRVAWAISGLVIFAVGASRVYTNDHWPTDVLAGWLLAALWIKIVMVLFVRFSKSR